MRTGSTLCAHGIEGIEPLGAFNQPVYRSYGQIRAALLNELGTPFADYFARPELDADGARIGWLAHELGEPRRWIDMSAEEQTRLDPARQRVLEGFAKYRAQLDAAPVNSPRNNFGKLLAQASCVPGPQYLYFVGEQPIVAFWGFKTIGAATGIDALQLVPGTVILSSAPEVLAKEAVAVTTVRRRWWWLWWLLGLLLLALLLLWLFAWWFRWEVPYGRWVGLRPPFGNVVFHGETTEVLPPPLERSSGGVVPYGGGTAGTVGENGVVQPPIGAGGQPSDLDHSTTTTPHDLPATDQNKAPGPMPPPTDGKTPPQPPADNTPAHGDLPPLPPAGGPTEHGPQLAMPPEPKPGPADFMQGVWRSRGGLMVNGSPAEEYYRFDKNGQGDVTLRTRDGRTQCNGPAHATIGADHKLNVAENPTLTCQDGSTLAGAVTQCSGGTDHTACSGTNQSDGSNFGVQIESVQKP